MNKTAMLLGVGLGAAIMYFLDPDAGRRRRAVARDKALSAANDAGSRLDAKSRDLGNRARGLVAEADSLLRPGRTDKSAETQ